MKLSPLQCGKNNNHSSLLELLWHLSGIIDLKYLANRVLNKWCLSLIPQGPQTVVTEEPMTDQWEEEFFKFIKDCSLMKATMQVVPPITETGWPSLSEDVKESPSPGNRWLRAPVR